MRVIKFTTKALATLAILAVAFGPFSILQQTPTAQACSVVNGPMGETVYSGSDCGSTAVTGPNGTTVTPQGKATDINGQNVDANGKQITSNECSGITGCLASMVYYVGPGFASWVASWSAYFFDFIVRISLNSASYTLQFLTDSWTLVLSLANMFFIFILVYAAFVIMLRAETARTLQTLAWVIAIALVVNFSFFFTRVIIDAGNIIGVQFYNAVATQPGVGNVNAGNSGNATAASTPDITKPLMSAIGVESLLGPQTFNQISSQLGNAPWSTLLVLTVIFLFTAVMFWILAIALLMVGLKFFLRVVGLWLVLVASPLAFVAQTLSNTRHFFDSWLRTLVSFSMYPAVFLFMFWVLNQFALQLGGGGAAGLQNFLTGNLSNAQGVGAGGTADPYTLLTTIANVSIRMMFIIVLLYVMLKVSDWVIEQAGGMASTFINRGSAAILGGGFRGAAWAGALAGRNTIGRGAFAASQNGSLKTWAANSRIGNTLLRSTTALSRSTFDARNAPGASAVGSKLGTLSRTSDVNTGRASQRNFAQSVDDKAKRLQQQAQALKASPTEKWAEQQNYAKEFEKKSGRPLQERLSELSIRAQKANQLVKSYSDKAAKTSGRTSAAYQLSAEKAKLLEKNLKDELKTHVEAGNKAAETNAKARIEAFANRLDKSNKEKMFNAPYVKVFEPISHGAIAGAAAIRGGSSPSQESTQSAKQHQERSSENRETQRLLREVATAVRTGTDVQARSTERIADSIERSHAHLGDKISELKHVIPAHAPSDPGGPAPTAPAAASPAKEEGHESSGGESLPKAA